MTPTRLREIGARHGFSEEAVRVVARELTRGGGSLAQFDHAELGGRGQWMPGMVQIGQMTNDRLKARVAALCAELASGVSMEREPMRSMKPMKPLSAMKPMASMEPMKPVEPWWPARNASPDATGGQNGVRYAYFKADRRLVVDVEGYIATYDTGDHEITGIAQAQADDASHLVFNAQHGPVALETLRAVEG